MVLDFIGGPLAGQSREVADGCRYVEFHLPDEAVFTGDMDDSAMLERVLTLRYGQYEVQRDAHGRTVAQWSGERRSVLPLFP